MNRIIFLVSSLFFMLPTVAQKIVPLYKNLKFIECKASEYISAVKYIPLETKTECLLNDEIEVIATSQYLFVHDFKADVVFRFDIAGRFLNRIGRKGQGPGEYKRLFGIYVDDAFKKCFLLDSYSSRIYVYSYDGKFLQQYSGPYNPSRMERTGDNYVLNNELYTQNKKELFLLDMNGKIVKQSALQINSRIGFMLWSPFFYKHSGLCYYKNYVSDNVYRIDDKLEKHVVYRIDCGPKAINPKENQYDPNKGYLVDNKLVVGQIKGYKDNLYITYCTDKHCFAIYNLRTGNVFSPGKDYESGFTDDLTNGPQIKVPYSSLIYDSCVEGQLVSILYCSDMKNLNLYNNGMFGQILKRVNEDDNPIIRIVTLK
jgi:hypothetical protein